MICDISSDDVEVESDRRLETISWDEKVGRHIYDELRVGDASEGSDA